LNKSIRRRGLVALVLSVATLAAQQHTLPKTLPLVLIGVIPLPGVQGRIDHLAFDPKGRLFVSALGNNTEEVLDLVAGIRSQSIGGIPRPQGVVYAPEVNKLFVGSDEGKLLIYDASSFSLLTSIDFGDDVDNLRYDSSRKQVYVGYGDEDAGAVAVVDATTNVRLPKEFRLGAHPESFQLENAGPNIYVNVPDQKQIAVINRDTGNVSRWPIAFNGNFPMSLDEAGHRLFVVTRSPARLAVFDTKSGHQVAALPCVQNSDDVFFDAARKRVYVPGGEGSIDVFQEAGSDHYQHLARIPSALGARTAGYFGKGHKGFEIFYVAVPARADAGAQVLMYSVQD
jgi:DNA-binding beta-propeller fold protein YncE